MATLSRFVTLVLNLSQQTGWVVTGAYDADEGDTRLDVEHPETGESASGIPAAQVSLTDQ